MRDYQYPLNRYSSNYEKGHQRPAHVGKTESIKAKAFAPRFRRTGQGLLLTAPELIHLLPLTDAVEYRIRDCRLTRELLDTATGRPASRTSRSVWTTSTARRSSSRIPKLSGTGVKGQHVPNLIIDEHRLPGSRLDRDSRVVVRTRSMPMATRTSSMSSMASTRARARRACYALGQQDELQIVSITAIQATRVERRRDAAAKAVSSGTLNSGLPSEHPGRTRLASPFRVLRCRRDSRSAPTRPRVGVQHARYRHIEMQAEEFEQLGPPMLDVLDTCRTATSRAGRR